MTAPEDDFARVLAEAGEARARELPRGERDLAALRAGMAEAYADRMARWLRNAAAREAAFAAYERANAAAGIEGRPPGHFPWMMPPQPPRVW